MGHLILYHAFQMLPFVYGIITLLWYVLSYCEVPLLSFFLVLFYCYCLYVGKVQLITLEYFVSYFYYFFWNLSLIHI